MSSAAAIIASAPRIKRGPRKVAREPADIDRRFSAAELLVVDAETGAHIRLNTRTVLERAELRGDAGGGGAASSSAAVHALPRLAVDVDKSAQLHMFIEAQRQQMIESVKLEERAEAARGEAIALEPMEWRRKRMFRAVFEDRVEGQKRLEKLRAEQETELLFKAKELGLL